MRYDSTQFRKRLAPNSRSPTQLGQANIYIVVALYNGCCWNVNLPTCVCDIPPVFFSFPIPADVIGALGRVQYIHIQLRLELVRTYARVGPKASRIGYDDAAWSVFRISPVFFF